MCGAYPTAGNHKIILLYHASARLDSMMQTWLLLIEIEALWGSADVHFVLLVRYHLNSLPAVPSSTNKRGRGIMVSRTIQYRTRSNSVRSSLNYGPAFSHSESRRFYKSGIYAVWRGGVTQNAPPPQRKRTRL